MVCVTIVCMGQVDRLSLTLSPELGEAVRRSAAKQGQSLSSWIGRAAADRLLNERLGEAIDAWEAEDGALTEEELRAAAGRIATATVFRPRRKR
jgi:hypothetical protein